MPWQLRNTACRLSAFSIIVLLVASYLPSNLIVNATAPTLLISPQSRPLAPVNSIVFYTVRVSSMVPFNAWDIMLNTTNTVLNATSLSINGNLLRQFGQVTELTNCVNGGVGIPRDQPGNINCTIDDGPGRVHSAAVLLQNSSPQGSSGLLFNITFNALSGPGTPLIIFNDILANAGQTLTYGLQHGVYGSPPPGFFMDVKPKTIQVIGGGWFRADVTLTGYGGFNANVNLNSSINPSPDATMIFTPKTVAVTSGMTLASVMNVTTTLTSKVGTYFVKVNATGNGMSRALTVTVIVKPPQAVATIKDFSVSASSAAVGDKLTVKTTVSNIGTIPGPAIILVVSWEGFVVTNHTITLSPNESKSYSDTWDTTGYPPANATLQWQIPNQDLKRLTFILAGPPVTPWYLDPLYLGVLGVVVAAPSFVYFRRRAQRNAKKKR